ncbi:MAG: hypothetical protein JNK14_04325 [Chitinophagaceae bacterium]|nr:hypothetical protein [Chitinophagaceae bacterium]
MTTGDVVILPVTEKVISKTTVNTIKKFNHTDPSRMYGRAPVELLDNIYMGDLAKNSLLDYLQANACCPFIDYDEVRTDDFHNADPGWDFKAGQEQIKTEVKSSIPTHSESRQAIIDKRDIKVTASHDKGNSWIEPADLESDIHVQVYFYARPYKKGYSDFAALHQDLNADNQALHRIINSKKYDQPLFFGWNTKQSIIQFARTLQPDTWSFGKTSRVYRRCPIKEAMTLLQLVEYFNTH